MTSLKTLLKSYLEEKEKYESEGEPYNISVNELSFIYSTYITGYSFFWIFEVNYIHEIRELYAKKLVAFEDRLNRISDDLCPEEEKSPKKLGNFLMCGYKQKKFGTEALEGVKVIHLGTREGFSGGEIFVDTEMTDARKAHKHELFIKAFKKLISDRLLVPDQSVVLVTSEDHHMLRTTKRAMPENKPPSAKKLKLENQAQVRQQGSVWSCQDSVFHFLFS